MLMRTVIRGSLYNDQQKGDALPPRVKTMSLRAYWFMKKAQRIIGISSLVLVPVFVVIMIFLYDYMASLYGRPDHFIVNGTAMAGLIGTGILVVVGIVSTVKGFRK